MYRSNAKRHGYTWRLSNAYTFLLVTQACTYCGKAPFKKWKGKKSMLYTGLDRIDNRRGYVIGNVVPACTICNSIKGAHLSMEEMRAAMLAILQLRLLLAQAPKGPRRKS